MPESPQRAPQKEPVGPLIGALIILILCIFGAAYYWEARSALRTDPIPYIPGDSTTTTP